MPPPSSQNFDRLILALLALVVLFAPLSIAATQISLGLAVTAWIVKMVWSRRWEVVATPIEPPLWAFIAVTLVASATSLRPLESLVHLKHLLLVSILYLIVGKVRRRRDLHRLAYLLIASASGAALWGLLQFGTGVSGKVLATQSTTMTFGAMAVMTATLTTGYLLFSDLRWGRVWLALGLTAQAAALSLSYVRGAYLGFAGALFLLAALRRRRLVIYLILGVILIGLFLPRDVLDRAFSITDLDLPSTRVRLYQWKTAVLIVREYPLLGVGWIDLAELTRQFAPLGPEVPEAIRRDVVGIGHFHNTYVMVWVYFGLVGFLAFLWLLLRIAVKAYRTHRTVVRGEANTSALVAGCVAAFGGFLVESLFDWTFGDAEVVTVLWILLGFIFAALRTQTEGAATASATEPQRSTAGVPSSGGSTGTSQ